MALMVAWSSDAEAPPNGFNRMSHGPVTPSRVQAKYALAWSISPSAGRSKELCTGADSGPRAWFNSDSERWRQP